MTRKLILLVTSTLALALSACAPASTPDPGPPPVSTPTRPPSQAPSISPPTETPIPSATPSPTFTPQPATTFPNPDDYAWVEVLSGLQRPVDLQNAGDGSGRLFIIEKVGRIRIFAGGQLLATPFLDLTDRVGSSANEQGLLGLAFHPRYPENGRFFVNYTDLDGNTVIARFNVTAADPDQANPNSETVLLRVQQPYPNHNGGGLTFGPDGYLYLGLGDGGSAGDPFGYAQVTDSYLGKILRLDVDNGDPYAIPPDNPFAAGGGFPEIWAYGLRNPWRFSFDPLTDDLYIADVGQNKWEEINYLPAGSTGRLNFGWNIYEGLHHYQGEPQMNFPYIDPVAEYSHQVGCSVTGGYVYRGAMPAWQGIYFYADYCSGRVWGLLNVEGQWQAQVLFETGVPVTSFGVDESGEIYLVGDTGQILRLAER